MQPAANWLELAQRQKTKRNFASIAVAAAGFILVKIRPHRLEQMVRFQCHLAACVGVDEPACHLRGRLAGTTSAVGDRLQDFGRVADMLDEGGGCRRQDGVGAREQ
jgi:hypothetical protein